MSQVERRTAMRLRAFSSAKAPEMVITGRREPERWAELRVTLNRLLKTVKRCTYALVVPGQAVGQGTQI